jgi:uncharacterized repeat protein (TIGR01451 family)
VLKPSRTSLTVVAALIAGAVALPAGVAQGATTTSLRVRVTGLPPGVAAKAVVRGPRFSKRIKRTRTFRGVRPGRYTVTVRRVRLGGRKGVKAGSLALPNSRRVRVRVRARRKATAKVQYGTIINANVRRLDVEPRSSQGDPNNPSGLLLPASSHARAGAILTAEPSTRLPAGLFHRVTRATRTRRGIQVRLRPARLAEAFPQLDIDSRIRLAPGTVAVDRARPSAFDPLVASLAIGSFRCSEPLADSRFGAQERFNVDADVEIHIPKKFGIPVGLPSGRLALTLSGSASTDIFIRKNTGCTAFANLPPLPGAIPVGPVVVPVYAQVGVAATASIGADLKQKSSAGFSLTAGMTFHGTHADNISDANASASASASGAGKVSVGPTIRLAVGVADVADVHLDAKPSLAFTAALDRSCSLDLVGGSQAGISFGPFQINQNLPAPTKTLFRCPLTPPPPPPPGPGPGPGPAGPAHLGITQSGPLGAFPNQLFTYTIRVTNSGSGPAHGVQVVNTVPADGAFVSSTPSGSPSKPADGGTYTVSLGDVPAGQTKTVSLRWRAPNHEATLTNRAIVRAANAAQSGPASASVTVGTTGRCNPCGAASAGTGLRNRDHGAITIAGIPAGATVGRAVLVWGILYDGAVPSDGITFEGHPVSADVSSQVSGNLCWSDTATVGYAADVTQFVTGNGTFDITDPPRGITRPDDSPDGVLPYTDGATLVVFYNGGGANNQVLSDFSYDTNTDGDGAINRSFTGVNSVGGAASLTLAGPDGQDAPETFTLSGAGDQVLDSPFDGSDHQDGPSFGIGNLWDTDVFDVSSILPAGQGTLDLSHTLSGDCIGVGAALLQVSQNSP